MLKYSLCILISIPMSIYSQQLIFPHGYFDSNKLKPFDAMYLNMMAQSNLEYGGVTLKELDALDAQRKLIPRPKVLGRVREEDAKIFDRPPVQTAPSSSPSSSSSSDVFISSAIQDHETAESLKKPKTTVPTTTTREREDKPKSPFQRFLQDEPMLEENPFEDIATRSPPRSSLDFRKVRRRLHKHHRSSSSHHHHHHNHHHRHEEDGNEDNIELDHMPTNEKHKSLTDIPTTTPKSVPTLIPLSQQLANRYGFKRRPNNPYNSINIREPTIIRLPIPLPDEDDLRSSQEFVN